MKLDTFLMGITRLYIDTAPFIYFTEKRAVYVDKMRAILNHVSTQQINIVTSAVTIPEILMKPLQANDEALVKRYQTMFYQTRGINVISVTPSVGNLAAQLRAKHNLKTPDALHIASAINSYCDAFLTNDIALKRVNEIDVLILEDLELSDI